MPISPVNLFHSTPKLRVPLRLASLNLILLLIAATDARRAAGREKANPNQLSLHFDPTPRSHSLLFFIKPTFRSLYHLHRGEYSLLASGEKGSSAHFSREPPPYPQNSFCLCTASDARQQYLLVSTPLRRGCKDHSCPSPLPQ